MPNSRAEKEPSREKPGNAIIPETADEQDQDGPVAKREMTFLEHAKESMGEHATLGRLVAQ